ncbi:MAG: sporulation protein Cse60 [Bacilli bacterium]|nr:sporulation protein Cse60 [Bacilli bacterium]MBR1748285.1 sporulation protein Cse60 [Bacilli bacterium]MBR1817308.1 sporulation protein Cse60 [Bacilli bacterium]
MKVKCFDENTEIELEMKLNAFLDNLEGELIDIKFQVAIGIQGEDQIYCFSALVMYT